MSKTKKVTKARKSRDEALKKVKFQCQHIASLKENLESTQKRLDMIEGQWSNILQMIDSYFPEHHVLKLLSGRDRTIKYNGEAKDYIQLPVSPFKMNTPYGGNGLASDVFFLMTLKLISGEYEEDFERMRKVLGVRIFDGQHHRIALDDDALRLIPTHVLKDYVAESLAIAIKEAAKS